MRWVVALALVSGAAGCNAVVREGHPDARSSDGHVVNNLDGGTSPIDTRICAGGDSHMTAPDGSCFAMFTAPTTYVSAKAACANLGAHLAYLKTAELDSVAETLVGAHDTFIGGTDFAAIRSFVWDDGTPFGFTNWEAGEPNDGANPFTEHCVIIAGTRVGAKWDDRPCDSSQVASSGKFSYLCQY